MDRGAQAAMKKGGRGGQTSRQDGLRRAKGRDRRWMGDGFRDEDKGGDGRRQRREALCV